MNTISFRFLLAILIVLSLSIIPLPDLFTAFRPPWVLMFVLYVQFYMPKYFRVTWVFFLGLALDVLLACVLGEHALALLLASCLAASKTRRFYFFSTIQQMFLIAFFCLVYQLLIVLMDASLGNNNGVVYAFITVFITMLFWPWVKLLADTVLLEQVS